MQTIRAGGDLCEAISSLYTTVWWHGTAPNYWRAKSNRGQQCLKTIVYLISRRSTSDFSLVPKVPYTQFKRVKSFVKLFMKSCNYRSDTISSSIPSKNLLVKRAKWVSVSLLMFVQCVHKVLLHF